MSRIAQHFGLVALLAVLLVSGCKLVKNEPQGAAEDKRTGAAQQQQSKFDAIAGELWQAKVLPYLDQQASGLAELKTATAKDLQAAGEEFGYRAGGDGTPWSFATRFSGQIVAANTDTRAATAQIDIDGDGAADAKVQLGPVIRGTALRDVLAFISFSDYSDQIEFASLSRALNTRAYEETLAAFPREDLVGRTVTVLGAFTLRDAAAEVLVTPAALTEGAAE